MEKTVFSAPVELKFRVKRMSRETHLPEAAIYRRALNFYLSHFETTGQMLDADSTVNSR